MLDINITPKKKDSTRLTEFLNETINFKHVFQFHFVVG